MREGEEEEKRGLGEGGRMREGEEEEKRGLGEGGRRREGEEGMRRNREEGRIRGRGGEEGDDKCKEDDHLTLNHKSRYEWKGQKHCNENRTMSTVTKKFFEKDPLINYTNFMFPASILSKQRICSSNSTIAKFRLHGYIILNIWLK